MIQALDSLQLRGQLWIHTIFPFQMLLFRTERGITNNDDAKVCLFYGKCKTSEGVLCTGEVKKALRQ